MPTVAIVILNWNGKQYLQRFLPSVLSGTGSGHRVMVADNASTDGSVSWLQQNHPRVDILVLDQNFGFAKGYNEALKQVKADYYVLLNSDVEVQPGWLEPMLALMESDTRIGACQPKILMEGNRGRFEYAGAAGGWMDTFGYPFARGRVFEVCEDDHGQYNDRAPIFWASGAAMFVRPAAYHDCGGLDEYFFAHMEEIDLCWRMQLAGYTVMACPQSVVYHVGGGTLPQGNNRKIYLNFRNNLIMLSKNLPRKQLVWKLPLRMGMDALAAWKALLTGNGVYFIAVLKAQLGFLYWCLFYRKQSVMPASRKKGPLQGWTNKIIVWEYFVRGKRKFSEIMQHKAV
ncbi:MAG: glycosyltransferase family 2 protein [Bacteroidota bacterium]